MDKHVHRPAVVGCLPAGRYTFRTKQSSVSERGPL